MYAVTAAFEAVLPAGEIDQDPAHQLGADREKVIAVLPVDPVGIHKPQERLVNEGGGLQRVPRVLPPHVIAGDPLQFGLHEWNQLIQRGLLTLAPREKKLRYGGLFHYNDRMIRLFISPEFYHMVIICG
jgi:hypothetical protein